MKSFLIFITIVVCSYLVYDEFISSDVPNTTSGIEIKKTSNDYNKPLDHSRDFKECVEPIKNDTTTFNIFSEKESYIEKLFNNGSEKYIDSKMNDEDYNEYVNTLTRFLFFKFSLNQLKSINKIYLINWEDLNDNTSGLTESCKTNVIYLPILGDDYEDSLLHEIWHCLYFKYTKIFETKIQDWNKINDYVSDYAETDLLEDIAETGRAYSSAIETNNKKIYLIDDIYKQTY